MQSENAFRKQFIPLRSWGPLDSAIYDNDRILKETESSFRRTLPGLWAELPHILSVSCPGIEQGQGKNATLLDAESERRLFLCLPGQLRLR